MPLIRPSTVTEEYLNYLHDGYHWRSSYGSVQSIVQFDDDHLSNLQMWLEDNAKAFHFKQVVKEIKRGFALYTDSNDDELERLMRRDPVEWMRERPLYRNIGAELARRERYQPIQLCWLRGNTMEALSETLAHGLISEFGTKTFQVNDLRDAPPIRGLVRWLRGYAYGLEVNGQFDNQVHNMLTSETIYIKWTTPGAVNATEYKNNPRR